MLTSNTDYFTKRLLCPVCFSTKIKKLYQLPYQDIKMKNYLNSFYNPQGRVEHDYLKDVIYVLNSCLECDLVYQEYIPNDFLMFKLYEEWIDSKIVFKEQEKFPLWYFENYSYQIINVISFFNKSPIELEFLDFGMGWGKWCLMAKAFGVQAYGLELSEARNKHARENGISVLSNEDLIEYKFDFINTDQVFEHIPNPNETLMQLVKSLKPNGVIKISVPNGYNILNLLERMDWEAPKGHSNSLNVVAPLEHINCFNTNTLLTLTEKCNLVQIDIPDIRIIYKSKKDFIKKSIKTVLGKKKVNSTNMFFKLKT